MGEVSQESQARIAVFCTGGWQHLTEWPGCTAPVACQVAANAIREDLRSSNSAANQVGQPETSHISRDVHSTTTTIKKLYTA